MEITPEMYLNLDGLEMHGPSSIRRADEPAPVADAQPTSVDEVADALYQAQRRGDHAQVGLLSAQLDGLVQGLSTAPQEPVVANDPTTPEETLEPSEELTEPSEDTYTESDFNRSLVNELGSDKVNQLYEVINSCEDEDVIQAFLESSQGEDHTYANELIDWARLATDAGATPDPEAEYSSFSEENITAIRNESPYADEIISLNQKLNSGEISQAQLFQQVMQDPALMAEAVKLRNANIISF